MFSFDVPIRVRYAETDQMGYVYYGNYATYYEVARVEALRSLGITYRSIEESGIIMPVLENFSKYIRPARYDDLLNIRVMVKEKPGSRIKFEYEITNQEKKLINLGYTTLVFVDTQINKPVDAPENIMNLLQPFF